MFIIFDEMLELMEATFRDFENMLPKKPKLVKFSYGIAYRFLEKDIEQAIILKLARMQSALRAALVLLENGFVQEQAILHRVIDETNEDIVFLAYAMINDVTDLHVKFLNAFWQEEIDESGNVLDSEQNRPMVQRKKIRAYIASIKGLKVDPHTNNNATRTLSKAYSGFVHGASPHIMDMYFGDEPHFHIKGMLGTHRIKEHTEDLWNPMYRGFVIHILVAKALGAIQHAEILIQHKNRFERVVGKSY